MTLQARLTRGDGARQWQSYRSTDSAPTLVFFRCPFCNLISTLDGGSVMADGKVAKAVTCPTPGCYMTYELTLEGWNHARTAPPTAYALCQHDMSSN